MESVLKNLFFLLLLLGLSLPLVQSRFSLVEEWPLHGHSDPAPAPKLTVDSVFSGEFADSFEPYLQENTGFRGHLIRLRNQIFYSVFRIAKANAVVVGKDDMLLDSEYISAYYGTDFVGEELLSEKLRMWKELQDTLLAHGTHAVLVFAPGKASYFPEYFPDRFLREPAPWTNYAFARKLADSLGVTCFDLKAYFHAMEDTSSLPLFTRGGIHWSEYGAVLAQMRLGRQLENLLGKQMDDFGLRIDLDTEPRGTDNDIELGMNLLYELPRDTLAYCVPLYADTFYKPKVLAIGDSYYWNLFLNGFRDRLCSHGGFWYYFREAHPDVVFGHRPVDELDLREEVLKNEVLMLMMTEPQLPRFGWGSIESLHEVFCKKEG